MKYPVIHTLHVLRHLIYPIIFFSDINQKLIKKTDGLLAKDEEFVYVNLQWSKAIKDTQFHKYFISIKPNLY